MGLNKEYLTTFKDPPMFTGGDRLSPSHALLECNENKQEEKNSNRSLINID